MGGEDSAGNVPAGFAAEVKRAPDHVAAILREARMSPDNVASLQVYLTDVATFQEMNQVYIAYFKDHRPARTTVAVARLVGPGRIESTTTAKNPVRVDRN